MNSQPASQPASVRFSRHRLLSIDHTGWGELEIMRSHVLLLKVHAVVSESATPRLQVDPACIHEVGM
jgi:hypothetical protein